MRSYWYGGGRAVRIPLSQNTLPKMGKTRDLLQALSSKLGFPVLVDWSNGVDDWDEVLVFAPQSSESTPKTPGREDLDAEFLVIWVRQAKVAGLFFAQMLPDLVEVLSMVASYEKALCEITEYHERFMNLRARHAEDVASKL